MKAIALAAALCAVPLLASWSARAETMTAGERGGFWCTIESDFNGTLAGKFKSRPDKVGPSCEVIRPGGPILDPRDVVAANDGAVRGRADFMYGGSAFFYANLPTGSFKRVSPEDVRNAPDKWKDRDIEFQNVHVYWVDIMDVRIVTATNLTVFARFNEESDTTRWFEKNCDTQEAALSSRCAASMRFRYVGAGTDTADGYSVRYVLRADNPILIRKSRGR